MFFNGLRLPPITISIGVAEAPTHGKTAKEIIASADKALYSAKQSGRNKVTHLSYFSRTKNLAD